MNRLHPRIQGIWALRVAILAVVVGIIGMVGRRFVTVPAWSIGLLTGLLVVLGLGLAIARYRRWGYEIRDDALYLERGVLTEVRTVVPLVRIQHVDSRRNPVERLVGLASTVVYTAGSRGADVRIPGLTPAGAQDLQERLKRLAILSDRDDAV